jgi:hypothetical protein
VSDFRLNVIADTKAAQRGLNQVAQVADKATRERKLNIDLRSLNKGLSSVTSDIKSATNNIKTFYRISKNVPGLSDKVEQFEKLAKSSAAAAKTGINLKESAKAGNILANSFQLAASKGNALLTVLAKLGLATFAVKEAVGILQSAWNGFFNNTIGREIKLRETILKTQTTLASTNKVFANGKEITDPYQKIVTLTGAVKKNVDSIRERSIALAGVTSNEVIEVFGIVASQVGQIGGGLKEAEDLAINFAAALGTFGIPLYQARQEIGSILRGDITLDSYLAKSLGITNEDIAKAKTASGGVVKFLEERLAAAVAGQKIAAEGFSGVVSNIADLGELIGQNFGRGLLDPLLAGLSAVFESLFGIRKQLFAIASAAGKTIGTAGRLVVGLTAGRTGIGSGDPSKAAAAAADVAQRGFTKLEEVAQRTVGALAQAIEALKPTALILVDAFKNIAEAFVRIKVGTFEALASALANIASVVGALAPSLATVFNLYARFLNTPIVQYFSEVAAVLGLLKRVGLDALTQLALFGRFILSSVIPAVGGLGTTLGVLVAAIAAVIVSLGKLILLLAGLATALVGPATIIPAVAAALKALSGELFTVGKQAVSSGTKLNVAAASFRGLGASAKAAGLSIIKSLGWIALIQVGLSVLIDLFGRYRRGQENQRSNDRAVEALRRLQTTYKDVGDEASSATKAARDFELAIVNANYSRNIDKLEEVRNKIKKVKEELKPGIQSFGEFLSAISGSELGRFEELARAKLKRLGAEEAAIEELLKGVDAKRDREQGEKDVKLLANQRVNLEKEIFELRRKYDNDLFGQRQSLAQKEVEIFRLAGAIRIKQIEKANAKLLEGEEGASRAALEALDNYIATRERGELQIEAAKKTLVIELANLEKSISDYRYETEKKIAELRKKSADHEQKSADARQRAAGGTTPAAPGVSAGFLVGDTGRSTGPHLDIRSPTGNKQAVIDEATAIIKAWQGQGLEYIQLSNAKIDVKNMFDEAELRKALAREQEVHGRRSGGGAIDISVPSGTLVPTPVGTPSLGGAGGVQATSLKTGNIFLHGRRDSTASPLEGQAAPASGNQTASTAKTELPDAAATTQRYAEAVRNVASAMDRVRLLQVAITEAQTAEAFERIAKAAFPQVAVEQYEDRLAELKFTYDAVSTNADAAFAPARTALEAENIAQIAIANRELDEIKAGIAKREQLSESERKRAMDAVLKQSEVYKADLEKINELKRKALALEEAKNFIQQSAVQVRDIEREIENLRLRNSLRAEGVAPELIQAELKKLEIRREMNRLLKQATPEQRAGIRAAAEKQAAAVDASAQAALEPGVKIANFIGDAKRELKDLEGLAIRVSQSIGDAVGSALTDGVVGLVEGTKTAQEVFSSFLKDIGQILLREAAKMIATYIAIGLAKTFAGLGTPVGGQTSLPGTSIGSGGGEVTNIAGNVFGTLGPNFGIRQRANGGPVSANMPYIVGERGPELFVPFQQGNITSNEDLEAQMRDTRSADMAFSSGNSFQRGGNSSVSNSFQRGGNSSVSNSFQRGGNSSVSNSFQRGGNSSVSNSFQQLQTVSLPFTRNAEQSSIVAAERETAQAISNPAPLNVSFESQVINGVEYVTAEQHRQGMAQAAERGRSLTLSALQGSVKTRKKVGLS